MRVDGSRIRGGWCPQRKKMVGAAVGVEAGGKRDTERHTHTDRERRRLELGTWNLEWGNVRLWDSSFVVELSFLHFYN